MSETFYLRGVIILFIVLRYICTSIYGQVYNYVPINHNDFETNSSILASNNMNNRVQLIHLNTFSSSQLFSMSSLRVSKYFESSFLGVGLSLNNTNMGNGISYNHVALGCSYRTLLLNTIYLKLGGAYKIIETNISSGNFNSFSVDSPELTNSMNIKTNMNLSVSFSSSKDRYYISFGRLNGNFPREKTIPDIQFPTYYTVNIGNLMSVLSQKKNSEISYSAFTKSIDSPDNKTTFSQYINLKFEHPLTRRNSLLYGARIGYAENAYFHLIPFISCFSKKLVITASYNFYPDKIKLHEKYNPLSQISLIYVP